MNEETKQIVEDEDFEILFQRILAGHNPVRPTLSSNRLQLLGLILVRFQRLENTIRNALIYVTGLNANSWEAHVFTGKVSFTNLCLMLSIASSERNIPELKAMQSAINKANKLEEVRNQIFHSVWSSGPRFKWNLNMKRGILMQTENYSDADLNKIVECVEKVDTIVDGILFKYLGI